MQEKTEKHPSDKAGKRKSTKTEPVPPAKEDKGHGEEVAPAREKRDAHGSPKKSYASPVFILL